MSRLLPDDSATTVAKATLLGAASLSGSYTAVALARSNLPQGRQRHFCHGFRDREHQANDDSTAVGHRRRQRRVMMLLVNGFGKEAGWRGFALPLLQRGSRR